MDARSTLCAVAAAFAGCLALPTAAPAQVAYAPCAPAGFECGSLDVPLDRSGAVAGTVRLRAARKVAPANPTRTAVLALAGGPGQAALPVAADFAGLLGDALATRDLLVFDQRGTGSSGRLRCAALERPGRSLLSVVRACATELGARRAFYRTTDSVEDIEALRAASGYERVVLLGVSYGTKVALDYAARYPQRVEALVLDSVVPPDGSDVLNLSTFGAIGRVLSQLCAQRACRGITANPRADLAALVTKLRRRPLRGVLDLGGGRREPIEVGPVEVLGTLVAGDLNPTLRAELPGSMRSALRGDRRPLLRLVLRAAGLTGVPSERLAPTVRAGVLEDSPDSDALFLATRCEESRLPWPRGAGIVERARRAEAAAIARRAAFRPFSARCDPERGDPDLPRLARGHGRACGVVPAAEGPDPDPRGRRRPAHAARGRPCRRGADPGRARGAGRPHRPLGAGQ